MNNIMNLYLLTQSVATGYDTYDSCVVSAESVDDARTIHPSEYVTHYKEGKWMGTYDKHYRVGEYENDLGGWVRFEDINKIEVKLIGASKMPRGLILASFNAG